MANNKVQTLPQLAPQTAGPKKFTPTPQQQGIIDHFKGHALVIAGPGSGKTVTLAFHVKKLILDRSISPNDVWVLSFNRDISSKLRERIDKELGEKSPKVTTIHTFILQQTHKYGTELLGGCEIAESLGDVGKSNLVWNVITKRLKQKHGIASFNQKRLQTTHVKGDLFKQLIDYWLTAQKPKDKLFNKFIYEMDRIKRIYKIIFLDELALKFLNELQGNPSFKKEVNIRRIVIDEFQDLNPTEHKVLQQFHQEGSIFIVFGDDDQAVNDFRKAHADYILEFEKLYKPTSFPLARDRRCPKEILDLADEFVCGLPTHIDKPAGYAPHKGRVDILNFSRDDKELSGIADIVKKYIQRFPYYDENPQILILSSSSGFRRGVSRITEIIEALKSKNIVGVTGEKKEDPFDSEWGLAFKSFLSLAVKGLSPTHLAAWVSIIKPTLMKKINEYIEEVEKNGRNLTFLTAAIELSKKNPKVEKLLSEINDLIEKTDAENFEPALIIESLPSGLEGKEEALSIITHVWTDFKDKEASTGLTNRGYAFLQILNKHISENIRNVEIGRIHVTTYRKAKGLEADLVIVSAVDSSEFSTGEQKRRLLYVAATRSKKNLILTYAEKITGARKFTRGRDPKYKGESQVFCSPLIPSDKYPPTVYSTQWLNNWQPV